MKPEPSRGAHCLSGVTWLTESSLLYKVRIMLPLCRQDHYVSELSDTQKRRAQGWELVTGRAVAT